ncbi:MAG: UDP-N-acetyl-D-mannosamine dehydrogenase [Ramlibacter sp.]|uniref:UDP-N-acetyl-D-mannosamine dehydrogenase n=1 Tax=Ramlibacter sp. TaxID=1917967 RepID=UPI0026242DBA|nr:UDP-N-acetyl-D-mannosamine dehydrogenase [Ramlibacter sp.]MDB5750651.1 UDP-N-acetyl-D-mannosamine dehydrogenase [Ramlibacter sp.]
MKKSSLNTISVIGLGYIGLPTAAMFASRQKRVIGVDINQCAVDTINRGEIHIVEPELDMIVHAAVTEGYLRATTRAEAADAFLIAVPTPFKRNHEPDLTYVRSAAESIAPVLASGNIVILESTSPVGTTEQMVEWLAAARPDLRFPTPGSEGEVDVHVAYCPERVLPGHVVRELVDNDRIIGGLTEACSQRAAEVYRIFVTGDLLFSNARTAEMSKLTENAFRDVNIAFANELSLICDKLDINVWQLIQLANRHPRVNILQPGAGVGGHCIAVDPWFIVDKTPEQAPLIRMAREVNDGKPRWVLGQIRGAIDRKVAAGTPEDQVKVAVLGLAFKPNIDDLRESPALHIAEQLAGSTSARLLVVEPNVLALPRSLQDYPLVELEEALQGADVVAVLVAHKEFQGLREQLAPAQEVVDAVGISLERRKGS